MPQDPCYSPESNPRSRKQRTTQDKMTVLSSSRTLHLLHLFLLLPIGSAITLSISNRCSYTIWPAAVPGGGMQLDPGESWTLNMPTSTTTGRVWPRTNCSFDSAGNGSCQTGDCGGVLTCTGSGQPPCTLAEFSIGGGTDFFDKRAHGLPAGARKHRGRTSVQQGASLRKKHHSRVPK